MEKVKNIHFIGIGGVGMSGLAVLLKARGNRVSGCDLHLGPRTRWLEAQGVPVFEGHDPAHLHGIDEVIVTPAVHAENDELQSAETRTVRFRGEVLAELVNAADSIAICGSHGKTTTATWTAKLLHALGEDVSWCIGGESGDFPVAHAGRGPLVVEADESDGTLSRYHARLLVVTNCEYDHPDHFKTPAAYMACYETARTQANAVIESEALEPIAELQSTLATLPPHNRKNARAAVEVALRRGHELNAICAVLPGIVSILPDRRFQKITDGVYTDYAHHPTEMACAVRMARQICRGTLRVLFQPHRYSRTKALLASFPSAFDGADEILLCPTYAAFESPIEGGDVADLYAALRPTRPNGLYLAPSCADACEHALHSAQPNDLTLLLGAGDIIDLVPRFMDWTEKRTSAIRPRRFFIGAGTNTWKSDLNLSVTYRKSDTPAGQPGATLGIPWMAGIPGTIGGWVKMNAGAFGHSISDVLEAVKIDGEWREPSSLGFGYRTSAIDGEIQDIRLKPRDAWPDGDQSAESYRVRRRNFPPGTFGSFFKNPPGDFAGRLLEAVGAKELRVGGAFVWSEHANVIVRGSDATPSDVLALARLMALRVLFRFGVRLEPEVVGLTAGGWI